MKVPTLASNLKPGDMTSPYGLVVSASPGFQRVDILFIKGDSRRFPNSQLVNVVVPDEAPVLPAPL